jgi:dihydroxyacetone kinase-like predicted kinase
LDEVAAMMQSACDHISSAEITLATRSAVLDGVSVIEGQYVGIADGRLCSAGHEIQGILPQVLEEMDMAGRELLSIYYGADVKEADAEALAAEIEAFYPDLEIEVLFGGQAIYHYILGAE